MLFSAVVLVALHAFTHSIFASPSSTHVVHGTRILHQEWEKHFNPNPGDIVPVRIGLTQRNLDRGPDWILDVADPKSKNYGKHWTVREVAEAFAPSPEAVDRVVLWLSSAGITKYKETPGWIKFNTTVYNLETLLQTKYSYLKNSRSSSKLLACDQYSVPAHLSSDIELILPSIHMNHFRKLPTRRRLAPQSDMGTLKTPVRPRNVQSSAVLPPPPLPSAKSAPKPDVTVQNSFDSAVQTCWSTAHNHGYITPDCLRILYGYMPNFSAHPKNSLYIPEYDVSDGHETYNPTDLDKFFNAFTPRLTGSRPTFDSVGGGALFEPYAKVQFDESDLDFEIAMTIVYPQKVTLLQAIGSYNDLIDAFDGSYCTADGGNDPSYDYGATVCGQYTPPAVISTSYSAEEQDLTRTYAIRQCHEYMKLGLMGTSVLYSSGDFGVAGNDNNCTDGQFVPTFPNGCPWLTSVGATKLNPIVGTQLSESAMSDYASGGGFSNYFETPQWQKKAVNGYLANYGSLYSSKQYNSTGRGYPDVSAMGQDIVVATDYSFHYLDGTSASTPLFASLLTLINQKRLFAGKSTVGFINPALYQNPRLFNDITNGSSFGCDTIGFPADVGWDPVTGLGTPKFPKLLEFFMSLQ